ncbi:hypothetical protein [Nitrosomonas sp.]|uniref:hypothetical protein n=1 Tax=Nitrosomonas sp. TaxID=42353 RepID=UPI002730C078|nr:hypothetical protein [Nitrosomonas sp.]MDP1787817.1 hypothetical protein [Nitrosomonas sp.]MDP2223247.1 hypothetical protein [Nitrosomonas sp.]
MTNVELKNKAVEWLWKQSEICKTRPYMFAPKEVTDAIGGVHTALGTIKDAVIKELIKRGVKIHYLKKGNKRFFELL